MALPVERRVFHCILDDTVLTTNISEIKKWAISGAITLFVPLYTIERLRAIKFAKPNTQLASNAGQALNFLDRATSGKYDIPESRVVLQGPLEQFEVWEDAQRFFLPEFEEEVVPAKAEDDKAAALNDDNWRKNGDQKSSDSKHTKKEEPPVEPVQLNEMSQMLLSKLNIQKIDETEPVVETDTSNDTIGSNVTSGNTDDDAADAAAAVDDDAQPPPTPIFAPPPTPDFLKPLLSCVLWQLHNAPAPNSTPKPQSSSMKLLAPLNSWVLVTNDWTVRNWALKYGIQVKTIHQLRTAILYEDKEYKNHVRYMERNQAQQQQQVQQQVQAQPEQKQVTSVSAPAVNGATNPQDDDETDTSEDELVFIPRGPKAGTASTTTAAKPAAMTPASPAQALSTPRAHLHRKSNSRSRTASGTPNHSTANINIASTPVSITDSSSLLEVKSSPVVVEIPSSPIDPDSFSRNIVVTRSPLAQTHTPTRGRGHGHGHGSGHGRQF
ncbi:hypothetical protein KEM56_002572 [Ascosphaera pollenicola]|nr:hypothetical protein KEM56_002572 [Ascosphaera pollenicola]